MKYKIIQELFQSRRIKLVSSGSRKKPYSLECGEWMDKYWMGMLEKSKNEGYPLFNGELAAILDMEFTGDLLQISTEHSDYKTYVCTRDSQFVKQFPKERPSMPLSVCIALITSDEKLIIEERKLMDTNSGKIHVIGGFCDPAVDIDSMGGLDPEMSILREIHEEIGLSLTAGDLVCLGLVKDDEIPHYELCYMARLKFTFSQFSKKFAGAITDKEVKDLEYIDISNRQLPEFIKLNTGKLTATAEPCLLLAHQFLQCKAY